MPVWINLTWTTTEPLQLVQSFLRCLSRTMQDFLFTSELQFGFKANKSCRDAMSVLCNTVEYYTRDGSICQYSMSWYV